MEYYWPSNYAGRVSKISWQSLKVKNSPKMRELGNKSKLPPMFVNHDFDTNKFYNLHNAISRIYLSWGFANVCTVYKFPHCVFRVAESLEPGIPKRPLLRNFTVNRPQKGEIEGAPPLGLKGSSGEKHIIFVIKAHKIWRYLAFLLFVLDYLFTQYRPSVLE